MRGVLWPNAGPQPLAGSKKGSSVEVGETQECGLSDINCIKKEAWLSDKPMCNASFKAQFLALRLVGIDSH